MGLGGRAALEVGSEELFVLDTGAAEASGAGILFSTCNSGSSLEEESPELDSVEELPPLAVEAVDAALLERDRGIPGYYSTNNLIPITSPNHSTPTHQLFQLSPVLKRCIDISYRQETSRENSCVYEVVGSVIFDIEEIIITGGREKRNTLPLYLLREVIRISNVWFFAG